MEKTSLNKVLALFLILTVALSACISTTQPISQEQQLRATIVALETQIARGQQPAQVTPTVPSSSSQEQQLLATIVALQTEIARSSASAPPTPTAIPSPTPLLDTQPGTVLEVGQTWRQGGLELTLVSFQMDVGSSVYNKGLGMHVCFNLTNRRPSDLTLRYSSQNFMAQDNLGRRLKLYGCMYDCGEWYEVTGIVHSGETVQLGLLPFGSWGPNCPYIEVDTADPAITEVVITISNISSISQARWRIPIEH